MLADELLPPGGGRRTGGAAGGQAIQRLGRAVVLQAERYSAPPASRSRVTGVLGQAGSTLTERVWPARGGTVHGVVSLGAHFTSNEAQTVAVPIPAALNTAVAVLPVDLQERPPKIELSEMVGGQRLH